MSLEPYRYRPATPENSATRSPGRGNGHSRNSSGSSIWSSPGSSNETRATTPCRSPHSPVRQVGPVLLPKIRPCDQGLEPSVRPKHTHRRALSTFSNPPEHASSRRPGYQRSTTSPPECSSVITPSSGASGVSSWTVNSATDYSATYSASSRGTSSHGRSTSTSGVDTTTLRRYGNPTYRTMPVYTTRSSPQYTAAVVPEIANFVPPELTLAAPAVYRELTPELECSYGPTTTITRYLTSPNPSIRLVARLSVGNGIHSHCWWDIRNLRPWTDFDLDTISAVPGFTRSIFSSNSSSSAGLLNIPIEAAALPTPLISHSHLEPANERALQDSLTRYYATKINAAIKTCQGHTRHITMRAEHTPENGPHFVSAYANDTTATLSGNGRGRLVGLVKPYEVWNTGMRHGKGQTHVKFLTQLGHLQRLMREHGTRYGFIMTEIELVCVRMGSLESSTAPYFGLLELADPIPLSNKGEEGDLTAGLALWYLHMLCADHALPGQLGYKVDVGPPVALTRQKVLPGGRDKEMQSVGVQESRIAKTRRGWVWPEDGFHRIKEGKAGKRG
ncbi:hypothetical protein ACLMJK_003202 [Lecanora helva]